MKKLFATTLVVAIAAVGGVTAVRAATPPPYGSVRGVVALVGDSNIVLGSFYLNAFLTPTAVGYVPVYMAAGGASIRWNGCQVACPNASFSDYWSYRIRQTRQRLEPDAWVVELGINDTISPGTATTRGYANYGQKVDYIMRLLPRRRPVLWTTLPCQIEPDARVPGCNAVNTALFSARLRWPNLTIADWGADANAHPEYMQRPGTDVHYSAAGYSAYTRFIILALNAKLPFG